MKECLILNDFFLLALIEMETRYMAIMHLQDGLR